MKLTGWLSGYDRLLTTLLVTGALGMGGTVAWYYRQQRAAVERAAFRELNSISDVEAIQIANWRRERLGDARVLMSLPEIEAAQRMLTGSGSPADDRWLRSLMGAMEREFGYSDATLADTEGNTYMRLKGGLSSESRIRKADRARMARGTGGPTLSDIEVDRTGHRLMTLTIPLRGGALILEIDPRTFLDPYLRSWRSASRTGETLLARVEGEYVVYLTERRYADANTLPRRSLKDLHLPLEAELPQRLMIRGDDYRGVPVLAWATRIEDSNWFLVAKVDLAEVHQGLAHLAWELSLGLSLLALAMAGGTGWIWKGHQLRMQRESEERLRSFANDTPALLWVVSADGRQVFANKGLSEYLGVPEQEGTLDWRRHIHPDDFARVASRARLCFEERSSFVDEARIGRADGAARWMIIQAAPRTAFNGQFLGYAGALLDINGRKKAEQQLRAANEELALHLAEKTEKEEEIRTLSARLINAQEEERRRLSRELHDDLSQQIAALSIGMGNLKRGAPKTEAELRQQFERIQQRLVDVSEAVRRMSHELHPSVLQHAGLAAALRGYCREFEGVSAVRVSLEIEGDFGRVRPDVSLTVFRIVQEALRNVAKHAGVNAADVHVEHTGTEIRLVVSDRGVGIPAGGSGKAGLGLVSIRERTRLVNGSVEIDSGPDRGTKLTVRIPVGNGAHTAGA